jgi:hypothetical protein
VYREIKENLETEQLEVNKPQHQRRPDISGGQIKRSLLFTADVEP